MKKHPVDDLFARRLTEWQPKASPDLWRRIEERQEKKSRRLPGWYWYAAASVALTLMAGFLVWQNQSPILSDKNRALAAEGQVEQLKKNNSGGDILHDAPPLAKVEEHKSGTDEVPENSELSGPGRQTQVKSNPENQLPERELRPLTDPIEVALIEKVETTPESLIEENKEISPIRPTESRLEIPNESLVDREKGRVVIAHIETETGAQEDPKSSKLIRILRQLKNAKQGEAIEWDEVGFNPKKLMARADERLRNEEEKVSKKYQELKDKTKL